MSVTFEWLTLRIAIVRLHPAPRATLGDSYVWWTVARLTRNDGVELKGADRPLPPGGARAVCQALKALGLKRRVYARIRNGRTRIVSKEL